MTSLSSNVMTNDDSLVICHVSATGLAGSPASYLFPTRVRVFLSRWWNRSVCPLMRRVVSSS